MKVLELPFHSMISNTCAPVTYHPIYTVMDSNHGTHPASPKVLLAQQPSSPIG